MQKFLATSNEEMAHELACLLMESGIKYSMTKRKDTYSFNVETEKVNDAKGIIRSYCRELMADISA